MNRRFFYKIYWTLLSFIVPALRSSQYNYADTLLENSNPSNVWLDLGCGHKFLPPWLSGQEKKVKELINNSKIVVGTDYCEYSLKNHRTLKNRVRSDVTNLPFKSESFDLITSNMVFEHLSNPEKQLKEIHRVLKKGGKLIFHTPNNFGYTAIVSRMIPEMIKDKIIYILEGRKEEDVFPVYYRINSVQKIERLSKECGFKSCRIQLLCSTAKFIIFPPLLVFELLWIRLLRTPKMRYLRTNIIATLEKG